LAAGDGIAVTARQNLEDHLAVLFAGEFDGRVDSHRRIAIPAVFAGELSDGIDEVFELGIDLSGFQLKVRKRGRPACLVVLPNEEHGDRGDRYQNSERH
jgi:hypothetical protein